MFPRSKVEVLRHYFLDSTPNLSTESKTDEEDLAKIIKSNYSTCTFVQMYSVLLRYSFYML